MKWLQKYADRDLWNQNLFLLKELEVTRFKIKGLEEHIRYQERVGEIRLKQWQMDAAHMAEFILKCQNKEVKNV